MLIGQVHVCRLLFKVISKIKESSRNGILRRKLEEERMASVKCYANIIIKNLQRIKNFGSHNFLHLSENHLEDYIKTSDFKKLIKVCEDYMKKYEASD